MWPAGARLGEGPLWSAAEGVVYWLDIKQPRVFRYGLATGARDVFPIPEEIGCVGLVEGGGLVAALRSGFAFLDHWMLCVAMSGGVVLGTALGTRVLHRIDDARFVKLYKITLTAIAARLIWSGLPADVWPF